MAEPPARTRQTAVRFRDGARFDRTLVWCTAIVALGFVAGVGLVASIVAMVSK